MTVPQGPSTLGYLVGVAISAHGRVQWDAPSLTRAVRGNCPAGRATDNGVFALNAVSPVPVDAAGRNRRSGLRGRGYGVRRGAGGDEFGGDVGWWFERAVERFGESAG